MITAQAFHWREMSLKKLAAALKITINFILLAPLTITRFFVSYYVLIIENEIHVNCGSGKPLSKPQEYKFIILY